MGMVWQQTRTYCCIGCNAMLLHDAMYGHWTSKCPARPAARLKAWLDGGRRYEPRSA